MSELKKGDLVTVEGRTTTYEVVAVVGDYVGLVSGNWTQQEHNSAVEFAVRKEEASMVGFRGTGADPSASPAAGAQVIDFPL